MNFAASPYSAPNSPIASSKRPRLSGSKFAPNTPGKASTSSNDNDKMEEGFDHNIETSNESVITENMTCVVQSHDEVPLFSPSLRKSSDNEDEEQELTSNELDESTETNSSSNTHADDSFNPYLFIATLPPHTQVVEHGKICLPKKTCPYPFTLALDLDETLVHCTVEPIPNPDIVFPVTFNGNHYQVYVRKRPYLDHFLESISGKFEIVVFTASQKIYAEALLNLLDPEGRFVNYRLYREACLLVHGNYLKDLTVLGRDMSKTVLVDNSPHAYGYQIDNGIPIESWFDDDHDNELLKLLSFLNDNMLSDVNQDVRQLVRNHFKTFELIHAARNGSISHLMF